MQSGKHATERYGPLHHAKGGKKETTDSHTALSKADLQDSKIQAANPHHSNRHTNRSKVLYCFSSEASIGETISRKILRTCASRQCANRGLKAHHSEYKTDDSRPTVSSPAISRTRPTMLIANHKPRSQAPHWVKKNQPC
jgi:hypothetical protein